MEPINRPEIRELIFSTITCDKCRWWTGDVESFPIYNVTEDKTEMRPVRECESLHIDVPATFGCLRFHPKDQ